MSNEYSITPDELKQIRDIIKEINRNSKDRDEALKTLRELAQQLREKRQESPKDENEDFWDNVDILNDEKQKLIERMKASKPRYLDDQISPETVRKIVLNVLRELQESLEKKDAEKEANEKKEQDEKEEP